MKIFNFKSLKIQLIIFLTAFAVYLCAVDKRASLLLSVLLCAVFAAGLEMGVFFIKKKNLVLPESAIITGLIIALVLGSAQPWFVYILAVTLALASKHIIRIQNKHIFNPAAFGILLVTLLLGVSTQWKGTYQWVILLPAGLYFIYRIRKMELLISYAVVALSLWGIQALREHVHVIYIFGYLSYFFIFIMLIEPKTTPMTRMGKILLGGIVAAVIFMLTEQGVRFDVELGSLLIGNAMVPLLQRIRKTSYKE